MFDYAWGQLQKALGAAADGTAGLRRATERAGKWVGVLEGMASGRLRVGSRQPVKDLPVWVTPEVLRGGFVTGQPLAGGPLAPDEVGLAERAGVEPRRAALFAWLLTDDGLEHLSGLLASGLYRAELPEHTALLTVAWLLRNGHPAEADQLLAELAPWASRLRFAPLETPHSEPPGVHVATIPEVAAALKARRPRPQVEAQREALAVWTPFTDRVLAHWWATRGDDGTVGAVTPPGWRERSRDLLAEYATLAAAHHRTGKHADPKGNLQRLLAGLRHDPGTAAHRHAMAGVRGSVAAMVAKRGTPGSTELADLRRTQGAAAASPSHALLAHDAARTLASTGLAGGHPDPIRLLDGTPGAGVASVRRAVRRATHGTLPDLLAARIVGSAEGLAELSPQLAAASLASRYADPAAANLAARTYLAFSGRRSLLLLNYESQVRLEEVPWLAALERVAADRQRTAPTHEQAIDLARLSLTHFPGTLLPNSLVRELTRLFTRADADVPLTSELAADIFMGGFGPAFARAADLASGLLEGTAYARYYDLDTTRRWTTIDADVQRARRKGTTVPFDEGVADRVPRGLASWAARNGRLIEQAQVLTTHNLAALVIEGLRLDWSDAAAGAWRTALDELALARGPRGLRHRKKAAYAWRQAVFFLSMAGPDAVAAFVASAPVGGFPDGVFPRPRSLLDGLSAAAAGGRPPGGAFYGWV